MSHARNRKTVDLPILLACPKCDRTDCATRYRLDADGRPVEESRRVVCRACGWVEPKG